MPYSELIQQRIVNQLVRPSELSGAEEVVSYMGAIQAQDYLHSRWAIGVRLPGSTASSIEEAFNAGRIIRTHVMRPTWHLVDANDLRWMLQLSAPQIKKMMSSYVQKCGLDSNFFHQGFKFLERALAGHQYLNRQELIGQIHEFGLPMDSTRANLLFFHAEADALICSGPRKNKKNTYAWMDDRVPMQGTYDRPTAIAALASRYFSSHAPATLEDFQWWSGLKIADARLGLEAARPQLSLQLLFGKEYWFSDNTEPGKANPPTAMLLPGFDEYIISYTDRTAIIDPAFQAELITKNGIFKPVMLHEGKAIGRWNRTSGKQSVKLEFSPFQSLSPEVEQASEEAALCFADFHELDLELI